MEEFNFEADGPHSPSDLAALQEKISEAHGLEKIIDRMEDDLKAAKLSLHNLKTKIIPDQMTELGLSELAGDGWRLKIGDLVSGSIPKDPIKRARAIRWLEDHGGGDLIKTNVAVQFGRSGHNEASDLVAGLRERGMEPKVESTVHPQTLQAFARERMKNGEHIDAEVLGLYTTRIAKFEGGK
jgi:hypothetical protein